MISRILTLIVLIAFNFKPYLTGYTNSNTTNNEISDESIIIWIRDDKGQPIAAANFTNQTKNYSYSFDSDGKLELKRLSLTATDYLLITCVGFKPKQLSGEDLIAAGRLTIILERDVVALKDVLVNAKPVKLEFKKGQSLPFPLSYQACTDDGQFAYTFGGSSNNKICTQALKYDPRTNSWSLLASQLKPRIQATASYIPSKGKIYIIGGISSLSNFIYTDIIESIDVKTGIVEVLKVKNPAPKAYSGAAVWNDKIYIFGGGTGINSITNSSSEQSFYEFDPATEKFEKLPDLPEKEQTSGAVVDGIIYVFGGYTPETNRTNRNLYTYNIKLKTWKLIGLLPSAVSANGIAVCDKLIFITGGYNNENFTGYLNTETQSFIQVKSNIIGRKHSGAVVLYDHLMVIGGATFGQMPDLNSVQVADLRTVLLMEK